MILLVKVTMEPKSICRQARQGKITPVVKCAPKAHAILWSREETEERMKQAEEWTAPGAEGESWTIHCIDDCDDVFEKAKAWALAQLEPVAA